MASDRVRFGINLPQASERALLPPEEIAGFARRAESLGYHSVWTLERILDGTPILESLVSLAYVAACTLKLRLGTGVVLTPLRTPAILAKQVSSLDYLSGGRVILGIALGGHLGEYKGCGVRVEERVKRFIRGLRVMRGLWSAEKLDYDAGFWRLEGAQMEPKPVQKHLPVWFGAGTLQMNVAEGALRRAARFADGWIGAGLSSLDVFRETRRRLDPYLREFKREGFEMAKRVYFHAGANRDESERALLPWFASFYKDPSFVKRFCVYGSAAECADQLKDYVEAGARTIVLHPVVDHLQQMEVYAKDVIPAV